MRRLAILALLMFAACDSSDTEPSTAERYCELMSECDPVFVDYDACLAANESPQLPDECLDIYADEIGCVADSLSCTAQNSMEGPCADLVQARIDCANAHSS